MKSAGITVKPPSPWIGSRMTHATEAGSTAALNIQSSASRASFVEIPRYGYGAGAR